MKTFQGNVQIPIFTNETKDPVLNVSSDKLSGEGGTLLITSSSGVVSGNFYAFVVQEDTIITNVYTTKVGDVVANHVAKSDITSATLHAGAYYSAGRLGGVQAYIDSIQVTSGSLLAYSL